MSSSGEDAASANYYYCEICKAYLTVKNQRRHERTSHSLCTVCLTIRGSRNHACNPAAVLGLVQWLTLVDPSGAPIAFVLGLSPGAVAANSPFVQEEEMRIMVEAALEKKNE